MTEIDLSYNSFSLDDGYSVWRFEYKLDLNTLKENGKLVNVNLRHTLNTLITISGFICDFFKQIDYVTVQLSTENIIQFDTVCKEANSFRFHVVHSDRKESLISIARRNCEIR